MYNLFDFSERREIEQRLQRLQASSARQWGRMNPAQMLAHCAAAFEVACGDRPKSQALVGRVLSPLVRSSVLGVKPFRRNAPTDPDFVICTERNFADERQRLTTMIGRFYAKGPASAAVRVHSFFGRMSGEEWGRLMYKHLDHHL